MPRKNQLVHLLFLWPAFSEHNSHNVCFTQDSDSFNLLYYLAGYDMSESALRYSNQEINRELFQGASISCKIELKESIDRCADATARNTINPAYAVI